MTSKYPHKPRSDIGGTHIYPANRKSYRDWGEDLGAYTSDEQEREHIQERLQAEKDLTPEHLNAITKYGSNKYSGINRSLRVGQGNSPLAKAMMSAFRPLLSDTVVYRGTKKAIPFKVGDTFSDKGFVSTSRAVTTARNFTVRNDGRLPTNGKEHYTKIYLPKGTPVIYGRHDRAEQGNSNEWELILPPNSKFKIHQIDDSKSKMRVVHADYIK